MRQLSKRLTALALALPVALAGCRPGTQGVGTMRVVTQGAVVASMAEHKTYAYDPVAPAPPDSVQWAGVPEALEIIKRAIDRELQARGYVLDPKPDLVVRISLGVHHEHVEPTGSAATHQAPGKTDDIVRLHIDVFDHENGGHLFHGVARDELHTPEPEATQLERKVSLILEPVPRSAR